jgi:antitoxin Phd
MAKRPKTRTASDVSRSTSALQHLDKWKLEDAKARLSEVVRRASTRGPQLVTLRGKEAAVILSAKEFERLSPAKKSKPLVEFLQGLRLREIPLIREPDTGREEIVP